MWIFRAGPELWNVQGEMACQPAHSSSRWSQVLLVWPSNRGPCSPSIYPANVFDRAKHAAPDADTRSHSHLLLRNGPAEAAPLGNVMLVQRLKQLTDRKQRPGVATGRRLGTKLVSTGLDSTWPCWAGDLFIGQLFSLCVYLPMRARVSLCVGTLTRRGVCLISTTEHSSGVTFSAIPRSKQTLCCACYRHTVGRWEAWLMRPVSKKLHDRHANPSIRYVAIFYYFSCDR